MLALLLRRGSMHSPGSSLCLSPCAPPLYHIVGGLEGSLLGLCRHANGVVQAAAAAAAAAALVLELLPAPPSRKTVFSTIGVHINFHGILHASLTLPASLFDEGEGGPGVHTGGRSRRKRGSSRGSRLYTRPAHLARRKADLIVESAMKTRPHRDGGGEVVRGLLPRQLQYNGFGLLGGFLFSRNGFKFGGCISTVKSG